MDDRKRTGPEWLFPAIIIFGILIIIICILVGTGVIEISI